MEMNIGLSKRGRGRGRKSKALARRPQLPSSYTTELAWSKRLVGWYNRQADGRAHSATRDLRLAGMPVPVGTLAQDFHQLCFASSEVKLLPSGKTYGLRVSPTWGLHMFFSMCLVHRLSLIHLIHLPSISLRQRETPSSLFSITDSTSGIRRPCLGLKN